MIGVGALALECFWKAAVVIPEEIDLTNDERLIKRSTLSRTQSYLRTRLPGLVGQRVVDSKFNGISITPDTHFIVDWHRQHENVLLAGGCSGHLFKHGPMFGDFTAGVAVRDYGTATEDLETQFAELEEGTLAAEPVEGLGDAAFSSVSDELPT